MARLKSIVKSISSLFQAIKYGNGDNDVSSTISGNGKRDRASHRKNVRNHQPLHKKLSTSDGYLNSNRDELHFQKPSVHSKLSKKNSKSVSDVPKLVAQVIEEAASTSPTNSSYRQPIRVINGINLSLQSQVLLNTRTSQPFEDLVRDLAMSVKIPNHPVGNSLQTLAGRQIRSYSQLRSELKAGQRTFYVSITTYGNDLRLSSSERSIYDKHAIKTRKNRPGTKTILGKVNSNSSSDISISPENHIHRKPTFNRMSHLKPAMPYFKSP